MKTNAIVRIVLYSVAILVLLGVLVIGLGAGIFTANIWTDQAIPFEAIIYEGSVYPESGSETGSSLAFDAATVKELNIEWAAGTITIQPGNTDSIVIEEFGSGAPMFCTQKGSKLTVQFDDIDVYFGITIDPAKDLVITVPQYWICSELEMDVASAEVKISDLTINSINFDGASGTCTFENCSVGDLDVDSASGDIHFTGSLNTLECDAASADCILVLTNTPRMIDVDRASGDLDITLPADSGFTVTMDGLSCDFSSDFDYTVNNNRYVCGDGSCRIEVDAMSGDLTIRKGN